MSRKTSQKDAGSAAERIRAAAIQLFRARGYHGTSIRDLAEAVQMETASLYYHYPSKQHILFDVFSRIMDDLIGGIRVATGGDTSTQERLRAAVRFHVCFHAARQDEAIVSHSELRALSPENLVSIIAKRDQYQTFWQALLKEGVATGCFQIADIPVSANAILMMCSGVSDWFAMKGRLSGDEIANRYEELVARMVFHSPHLQEGGLA